jgi:hypothetical protein
MERFKACERLECRDEDTQEGGSGRSMNAASRRHSLTYSTTMSIPEREVDDFFEGIDGALRGGHARLLMDKAVMVVMQ